MNIIFMGTPDFAAESLKAVIEKGHNIMAVVTNPDRPKGRGMKMIATPVKEVATQKNIPVYQPLKVRGNEEFIENLNEYEKLLKATDDYKSLLIIENQILSCYMNLVVDNE